MSRKKNNYDEMFDNGFEVTYTEDLPPIKPDLFPDEDEDEDAYDELENSEPRLRKRRLSRRQKQDSHRSPELAAPIRRIMYTGSTTAERLARLVFRPAPVLMAAAITLITLFFFWMNSANYGDITRLTTEPDYNLIAYLAVGGCILLWEICCFFFTLSGVWSRTGRGLGFFILVYVLSYLASLAGGILPDELLVLEGIKGGLATFGSIYSMLFPFCIIGTLTCLVQKIAGPSR